MKGICPKCAGSGQIFYKGESDECSQCGGVGEIDIEQEKEDAGMQKGFDKKKKEWEEK